MINATPEETVACHEFLQKSEYAVVATVDKHGAPHTATVTYLTDDALNLYFFTRKQTHKTENLKFNPKIAVIVGTGPAPQCAQISGEAEELSETESDEWMSEFMTKREGFYITFLKLKGYDFIGFRVKPTEIRWLSVAQDATNEQAVMIKV